MAGIYNKDSSFFEITSDDIKIDKTKNFTTDLISLNVTERTNQLTQGTIQLYDPNQNYSKNLRLGMKLKISWGYKNRGVIANQLQDTYRRLDIFSENIERRGLEVIIDSPSGGGSNNGIITYNANFTSLGWRGDTNRRKFETGTRADLVHKILDELGVPSGNRDIRFGSARVKLTTNAPVIQNETNFAFLTRLATEDWRTVFDMHYDQKGQIWAIFLSPENIKRTTYQQNVLGIGGRKALFSYMGELNNVLSYTWKNNQGRSGTGAGVNIEIIDGVPTIQRFVVEDQIVETWKLKPEYIEAEMQRVGNQTGLAGQFETFENYANAQSFEEVQHFFDRQEVKTAPQGYGYEVNIETFGDPLLMPTNIAVFDGNFPAVIGSSQADWYVREVNHKISTNGYFSSVNVVDAFTLSPTGGVV